MSAPVPIERLDFEAQALFSAHAPVWRHPNKQVVFDIACPPGAPVGGHLAYSRWAAMELPPEVELGALDRLVVAREGYFDYESVPVDEPSVDWHVNFADPRLFVAYGSALFAQDEMQVAEHPVLGALKEALIADGRAAVTIEDGQPTPILINGAERRVGVATEPNAPEGRPDGLYGSAFGRASADVIARATTRIDPPTITNLLAMAAPAAGHGPYRRTDIEGVLVTAFTGFRAARIESERVADAATRVAIHTGYWGCGAFGGNRVLMAMLQVVAARMAGLDRLVFHTGPAGGETAFDEAVRVLREDLGGERPIATTDLIDRIDAKAYRWGVSDGN